MVWTVVTTKAGRERKVERAVSASGFAPWLPEYTDRHYHRRLLLPRYIFILWDGFSDRIFQSPLYRVLTKKVWDGDARPVQIPDEEVAELRDNCNGVDFQNKERFIQGEAVTALRGHFASMIMKYVGLGRNGKVELADIELLGRCVRTEFDLGVLAPAVEIK